MRVAARPNKLADLQAANGSDHVRQKRIAGDVERQTEKHVARALIELTRELPVCDIELKETVARRKRHTLEFSYVPSIHKQTSAVRIRFDRFDQFVNLINIAARILFAKSRPMTPLPPIDWPQFAKFVGPLVPDMDVVLLKVFNVCVALQKPQQFMHDALPVNLFRRDERKALGEIEAHLSAKDRTGTDTRPIHAIHAVLFHVTKQIEVLPH